MILGTEHAEGSDVAALKLVFGPRDQIQTVELAMLGENEITLRPYTLLTQADLDVINALMSDDDDTDTECDES